MKTDDPWFRPKAFGFGFTPVSWQGWLLTIGYAAVAIALDAALRAHHRGTEIAAIVILTAGFLMMAIQHTEGGVRWRWGDGE